MISRTVEYALRAIVWLASRPESPRTTRQIAEATRVPGNYLSKVLQTLVDAGIITSQRGLGGGFLLARDPRLVTVLEVVNAVAPIQRIRSCPLHLSSHAVRLCALHRRLDDALEAVERAFAACTIAELITDGDAEQPLCPEPGGPAGRPVSLSAPASRGKPAAPAARRRRSPR